MAAFIPSKDEERNNQVLNKVKRINRWKLITVTMAHGLPTRPCGYGNGGIQRHSRLP